MANKYAKQFSEVKNQARSVAGNQRVVLENAAGILAGAAKLAARYGKAEIAKRTAPKKSGLGGFIAAGFAVALVAGVAYVAWQTLRTDDESWVDDDFDLD